MRYLTALFLSSALLLAQAPGYHIIQKIPVGGEGGWDYLTVDSAARRLYVSHATKVVVVDLEAGKVAGEIPETPGVHGIAIAAGLGKGFISAGRANHAVIFDLKTLKTTGQVATGRNPDAILYEPSTRRVFTFNGASHDATVIDAAKETVISTLDMGGKPEFAVTDGKGKIWVNNEDTAEIWEIDAAKPAVARHFSLGDCKQPSGLAIDVKRGRLFSVCRNAVMVISDIAAGKAIATAPIGQGTDGAGFDDGFAFSSNGDGTLTVVREESPGKFSVAESVPTMRRSRTMTVDPRTHRVYLAAAEYGAAPAPAEGKKQAQPAMVPGSFQILVVGR